MDKVALRNFAVNAKEKLEKEVRRKLELIGITENKIEEGIVSENDYLKIGNVELNKREIKQREILVKTLKEKVKEGNFQDALNELIEEIAYTWFNRIIAIRFMEVNDYLNDRIRILSSERENDREPQIIREVFNTDLEFSDDEKNYVYNLKEESKTEELFRFLFIKKCNKLNEILPELFEEAEDYSELLLPISINDEEGILRKLVDGVPKESFDIKKEGQIEVIGWLYQYYNEEKKNKIVGMNKGTIAKKDIPTATQIFTTDWVVKYMIQNSLGKYWIERNPDSKLKDKLEYFVTPKNGEIAYIDEKVSPEEIKFLEPCMGSGHILVHAFDILMEIYREEGYSDREAVRSIIENNIYGLDIDKRAYQLAYFAVMMKGREYDRRFFTRGISPNVTYTEESYFLFDDESKKILRNSKKINMDELRTNFYFDGITIDDKQNQVGEYLIRIFEDAGETGSLIKVENFDYDSFDKYLDECKERYVGSLTGEIWKENVYSLMKQIVKTAKILKNKYHIVCTNPPYLNKYNPKLKKFVETNYKNYKGDLFSVFMVRVFDFLVEDGYSGWMTPNVWMFIKTYEELRRYIIENKKIESLIQIAKGSFYKEATVDVITFVLGNSKKRDSKGLFIRLEDYKGDMEFQSKKVLEVLENKNCGYFYEATGENFEKIPGIPIGYWVSDKVREIFETNTFFAEYGNTKKGVLTGNDLKYTRIWHEVSLKRIGFFLKNYGEMIEKNYKWIPATSGGSFRKWYGNLEILINMENDSYEIKYCNNNNFRLRDNVYYFKKCITWSEVSSKLLSNRFVPEGILFGNSGPTCFAEDNNLLYILSFLNSTISMNFLKFLSPTLTFGPEQIKRLPLIFSKSSKMKEKIDNLVQQNIDISKEEWDSRETSWDFEKLSLIDGKDLKSAFEKYCSHWRDNFVQLHKNEEELNRLFIEIYDLQDEMDEKVEFENITILKEEAIIIQIDNNISKEFLTESEKYLYDRGVSLEFNKNVLIKQFISYAVGCMFGRYSLDEEGLAFAGGEFDKNKYSKFISDEDNCIPITDSEYFSDDIVTRFVEFVKTVYGEETLEENLKFIAQALSNKNDAPKDIIREYFLKSFYDDHLKRYKKRPIYWLYDAGKKNGFKALIYMHRYNEQTTAKVRIGYLHELQKHYERRASFLKDEIESNNNRKKAEKELKKIKSQLDECKHFDEKMNHLASEYISIDLDDGVKVNYEKVQTGRDGKKYEILGKVK